jgi:hypothetical protein
MEVILLKVSQLFLMIPLLFIHLVHSNLFNSYWLLVLIEFVQPWNRNQDGKERGDKESEGETSQTSLLKHLNECLKGLLTNDNYICFTFIRSKGFGSY